MGPMDWHSYCVNTGWPGRILGCYTRTESKNQRRSIAVLDEIRIAKVLDLEFNAFATSEGFLYASNTCILDSGVGI